MVQATLVPKLRDFGTCAACGRQIGWVQLGSGGKRPVDPEPHPKGEYLLMRDGRRVAAPHQDPRVAHLADRNGLDAVRYFDHNKTCPIPSLRTFAGGASLHYSRGVYGHDGRPSRAFDDPMREERRAALLERAQRLGN